MKIVKESLYESLTFREDSDPIEDMGIGSRALIKKWFATWAPNSDYTIDDNLNIEVKEYLYLHGTEITELPDNLTIEGSLDLAETPITKLPDNLSVGGYLNLSGTLITSLPDNLSVGLDLYLEGTPITELPKYLKVKRHIYKDLKDENS